MPKPRSNSGDSMRFRATYARAVSVLCVAALAGCAPSIHDVVGREDLEQAKAMLAEDPALVHARNSMGKTPLHYAVTYGAPDLIDLLVSSGADVNAADHTGLTPLHVAAMIDRSQEARRLVGHNADLEARDSFGDTPLQYAALHGQLRMVKLLIEAGADTATVNDAGLSPLESARQNRKGHVVEFFRNIDDCDD